MMDVMSTGPRPTPPAPEHCRSAPPAPHQHVPHASVQRRSYTPPASGHWRTGALMLDTAMATPEHAVQQHKAPSFNSERDPTLPDNTRIQIAPHHTYSGVVFADNGNEMKNEISRLTKSASAIDNGANIGVALAAGFEARSPASEKTGIASKSSPPVNDDCGVGIRTTKVRQTWEHDFNGPLVLSDVESFDGKIVYNPDGSAYIIEGDSELSDTESLLDLPQHEGTIVESRDKVIAAQTPVYPQIANAFYVSKNSAFCNPYFSMSESRRTMGDAPVMHSYKVLDLRSGKTSDTSRKFPRMDNATVPTKPILMCFICKLSFGYTKSFVAHAISEHNMVLSEQENEIMSDKCVSAIIQALGVEKEPLLSFLVPNNLENDCSSSHGATKLHDSISNESTREKYGGKDDSESSGFSSPEISENDFIRNNNNIDMKLMKNNADLLVQRFSPKSDGNYPVTGGSAMFAYGASDLSYPLMTHCEDHPQGRLQGVECPKCDLLLSSSRSLGGHMTMMHSRNSCKTLKCPKCNWHYKYQETLEIHMKEKHPENESHCIYCLAHQPHPRLARGESYTCGYKPYRCDVCNYSTTTKGNLSIHMQSDKHINNVQDLQNGTQELKPQPPQVAPPTSNCQQQPSSPPTDPNKNKTKAKPTWRCDVCNYETNVARNLRIHMTSEKHTHNMLVLQQNVKHMQRDMHLQMNTLALYGQQDPMLGLPMYDQYPMTDAPVDLSTESKAGGDDCNIYHCCICNVFGTDRIELIHQHMQLDRTKAVPDDNVSVLNGNYLCQLCQYKTNLKANFQLHCKTDKHLQRLQLINHIKEGGQSNEWRVQYMNLSNPVQIRCNTCDFYTNSIHKLQLHETSPRHDFHVRIFAYLARSEMAVADCEKRYYQCTLCNFPTKTKIRLMQHIGSVRHLQAESLHQLQLQEQGQVLEMDFGRCFLVKELSDDMEISFNEDSLDADDIDAAADDSPEFESAEASCSPKDLCNHQQTSGLDAIEESTAEPSTSEQTHLCPFCKFSTSSRHEIQSHVNTQHVSRDLICPLCQDEFKVKEKLERHLCSSHHVSVDAMQRLMMVVDANRSWSPVGDDVSDDSYDVRSEMSDNDAVKLIEDGSMDVGDDDQYRCSTCNRLFVNIDALYAHQNELGHLELKQTPRGPGYLCWKKGCNQYFKTAQALQVHFREIHARQQQLSVSDRHVYRYRCNQCSLAFKTIEKLQMHAQYHAMRAATKCIVCERSFRTVGTMKKHVETSHVGTMTPEQLVQYSAVLASMPMSMMANGENNNNNELEGNSQDRNHTDSPNDLDQPLTPKLEIDESSSQDNSANNSADEEEKDTMEDLTRRAVAEDSYNDPNCKFKCLRCKVAFTKQNYLSAHNKTNFHRKGDKFNAFGSVDKFNDPNRPYKCDICRESFTQKNILLVHYNSVSHLHKLKQSAQNGLAESIVSSSPTSSSPSSLSLPAHALVTSPPITSADTKPYRCNICNVAYSQVSTLEIHMRSVLHQSRATKLQESNERRLDDESRPRSSEIKDAASTPPTAKRPTSLPASSSSTNDNQKLSSMPSPQMLPPLMIPTNSFIPMKCSQSPANLSSPMFDNHICTKCGAVFPNQDLLIKHQQIYCCYSLSPNSVNSATQKRVSRHRTQVQKNLLESFGFECVMQFNEYNQSRRKDEGDDVKVEEKVVEKEVKPKMDVPEINKMLCGNCKKEFSSIWVLKAHQEEIHGECVPLDFVERLGEEFKVELDRKIPIPEPAPTTPPLPSKNERSDTPNSDTSSVKTESQLPMPSLDMSALSQFSMMSMMQMPMSLGFPMAMGMQPPLMPLMLPTMGEAQMMMPPFMDSGLLSLQKFQQQQQAAQQQAQMNQQKRARTRINDEQLKILRAHFDINNSPSEEQIVAMSEQSGLPLKVIKHWFRNTLFKERQRNKDSPYNFNNPPSTTLNLEEYEKTGRICSEPSSGAPSPAAPSEAPKCEVSPALPPTPTPVIQAPAPKPLTPPKPKIKEEPRLDRSLIRPETIKQELENYLERSPMRPALSPHKTSTPIASSSMMDMYLSSAPMMSMTPTSTSPTSGSDSSFGINSMSRRANRTRFTDYQIKVLQEYFEQNAYPKDDDLEQLSKMLNLSPRVIVVWFQNARQKARKVYENQPSGEQENTDDGRFVRTPGLNYQCKKCMTVFQRYYELIKHQKKHCFKDEDITMSHVFGKDRLSHSTNSNHSDSRSESNASEDDTPKSNYKSPDFKSLEYKSPEKMDEKREHKDVKTEPSFNCDKCSLSFTRFDHWQEHQNIHIMNPTLFQSFAPDSAFGMLQNLAQQQQQQQERQQHRQEQLRQAMEDEKLAMSSGKRKLTDEEDDHDNQSRDKRLRTTILPEQLDYLYQKYQLDCNPSRKQLETIATDVGLKKRVVQVWFQNTRARERKGQYRAHQQLIHKRCPFCRALFRAKSALESHLATKHPDELAKGDINIDAIPDAAAEGPGSSNDAPGGAVGLDMAKLMQNPFAVPPYMPFLPPGGLGPPTGNAAEPLHSQMKKMYEDSLKRYLDEITPPAVTTRPAHEPPPPPSRTSKSSKTVVEQDAPLDLSKPSKTLDEDLDKSFDLNASHISWDDSRSENEYDDTLGNPGSPSMQRRGSSSGKRYRTQMSSLQIRLMKSFFVDYKTPTMAECEMLGREIGLPKRVIQVWFQNARAKEKKAKAGSATPPRLNPDEGPPSEQCKLCDFKYTHKYSVQDHLFTKTHIDKVKKHLKAELEKEHEQSGLKVPAAHTDSHSRRDSKNAENHYSEINMSTHPHLAQLQAMGLQAMGLSPHPAHSPASSVLTDSRNKSTPNYTKKESKKHSVKKEHGLDAGLSAQMMLPFGPAIFPGQENGYLPFMYPGMTPFYPGLGLPFLQPSAMFPGAPGAESIFSYDPASFGTPLALLQIPQQSIRDVTSKLSDAACTSAAYTQDCRPFADLKPLITSANMAVIAAVNVDVGHICKKCHMVYPAREACKNHQRMLCYAGKSADAMRHAIFKLEQTQYECKLCLDRFSTQNDVKQHCDAKQHTAKLVTIGIREHLDVKNELETAVR